MKRILSFVITILLCTLLWGCDATTDVQVVATTAPIYEFTQRICNGTDIRIGCLITESVSCLHDYTLQTSQMRQIENAQLVIISGAGLEDFMSDILAGENILDASDSIELLCSDVVHDHDHDSHIHHEEKDPHIWLSPTLAQKMARNICDGLKTTYPHYAEQFSANLQELLIEIIELETYAHNELASLSEKHLITFHDGFAYLAQEFDLKILHQNAF